MTASLADLPTLVTDELDILAALVPLGGQRIAELGCGAAHLARALLQRHPDSRITALEVDERQHAQNLTQPQEGLHFVVAGAQAVPLADASQDLALMLKSLHHVPMALLDTALAEARRILRPGGHLYVSEPVYAGAFNELIKLFNDEGVVRAQAQAALDRALASGAWRAAAEHRFDMPVRIDSFEQFETRLMRPSFADHGLTDAKVASVRQAFQAQADTDGRITGTRPMHVRLLQRR